VLARVRHLTAPPIFEDEHQNRTAQLLNAFLLFTTGLSLLGILSLPFLVSELLLPFVGLLGGSALIYLICLTILRRRHLRAASIVFIITYWMVQNLSVGINGGMTSPSILNYATAILIAGFLLGLRASIAVTALTILVGAGFVYADAAGMLSPPVNPVSQSIGWTTLSFNLIALAVVQHWATRNLKLAADRARHSEEVLSERNSQLERAIAEHQHTENALRASEERYRVISELTSDYAFAYYREPDGSRKVDWLIGSPAALTGYDLDELNQFADIYHPDDAERARSEVERTLQGETTEGDYRIVSKDGQTRWIHTHRQPIWDPEQNRFSRYYATIQNITEQKVAGEALQQTQELRRQFLEQLRTLHEVSLVLTRTETLDELSRLAVELGRSRLGFDRMSVWFLDKSDPECAVGSYGTDESGFVRDEHEERTRVPIRANMVEILDGRVFITTQDDAPLRGGQSQIVGHGWVAAAKLRVGDQHTGWVFIDNLLKHEPRSDYQLELLALYAATISHLATAKTTLEELHQTLEQRRQFLELLKILHEVGLELTRAETLDDLCRTAVELGRNRLGFDRVAVWFVDSNDPNYILGRYGTDERGQVRDERHHRVKLDFHPGMDAILDGRVFITAQNDAALRDQESHEVGQGWNAAAKLRVGDQHTGWVFIDNLLRREPRSDEQLELLALYTATIGHLATAITTLEELRHTLEQHRQFLERLKALHEVGLELSRAETLDDLSRLAVELGSSKLGFDRLGLWFLDSSDPMYSIGAYGTDEQGLVKDESAVRVQIGIGEDMIEILDGRVFITRSDEAPLRGNQSQIIGRGWNAVAKVRFGDRHTGWLFIDNLLKREPRSNYQLELLALYAATIGHLATAITTLEELRYSESRLQQSIRLAQLGIWEWDIKTDITLWSGAMYDIYGISPEEFSGRGEEYLKMTHPDDQAFQNEDIRLAFERATAIGTDWSGIEPNPREYRIIRPDNTICYAVGYSVTIVDQDRNPVRMVGILMDVTDRKNAEKQALELALVREREENLREFISTISHDLKTPLSVINTSLYLLERITDPERHQEKVQTIKAQAQLLEKYIQDILTISRLDHIPHMTHQPVSLNRSLDQIVRRLHTAIEQKNITTTLDLDDSIEAVFGDENEINRALVNLIENAMNYTPPNGSITIQTSLDGDSVVTAITDTGIGISEDDLPHIFERFYRASAAQELEERGTGLGLAIVKRIVELHHGSINVESTVGQGTSFRVRFPLYRNSTN
jgi:PAS domain S-box-containing protein